MFFLMFTPQLLSNNSDQILFTQADRRRLEWLSSWTGICGWLWICRINHPTNFARYWAKQILKQGKNNANRCSNPASLYRQNIKFPTYLSVGEKQQIIQSNNKRLQLNKPTLFKTPALDSRCTSRKKTQAVDQEQKEKQCHKTALAKHPSGTEKSIKTTGETRKEGG